MKKFFSLIALVGAFAACQPEKLTTAFEVGNATATITVKVIDVLTGTDVTSSATISSATTLTGTPALAEQDYTVSATYKEGTGSATIHINALKAGGRAAYTAIIPVGGTYGDYTFSVKVTPTGTESVPMWLKATHTSGYTYSHNGHDLWLENASEFILEDSYSFPIWEGSEVVGEPQVYEETFADAVNNLVDTYNTGIVKTGDETVDFQVSAWALYNVFGNENTNSYTAELVATPTGNARVVGNNGVVGSVDFITKVTEAAKEEIAHPDYASHYIYGHGTGYKEGTNAGGGIVEAE
ncbi:MAG: DUF3869 domain-containing protein [Bacteroidales bacterium]|nr:DUF3869 domain-containing protein [Bacteroidales bacterium]